MFLLQTPATHMLAIGTALRLHGGPAFCGVVRLSYENCSHSMLLLLSPCRNYYVLESVILSHSSFLHQYHDLFILF